ncbi:VOC family protein [Streptomyces sp. Ac-502]|uniref:VOC family protein n=1 Tax=Streptomyces sp. Ac-502 TaxID=3342801 RepID=UPI0038622137
MADIRHTTAGGASQQPGAPARFKDLALDARDHQALADWWCEAMGYVRRPSAAGEEQPRAWPVPIVDPAGRGPLIWINPVAEPKTVKNRMHLDVWGDTGRLLRLGATLVRKRDEDIAWDVLADPEGNEFCVFAPAEVITAPGEGS